MHRGNHPGWMSRDDQRAGRQGDGHTTDAFIVRTSRLSDAHAGPIKAIRHPSRMTVVTARRLKPCALGREEGQALPPNASEALWQHRLDGRDHCRVARRPGRRRPRGARLRGPNVDVGRSRRGVPREGGALACLGARPRPRRCAAGQPPGVRLPTGRGRAVRIGDRRCQRHPQGRGARRRPASRELWRGPDGLDEGAPPGGGRRRDAGSARRRARLDR